LQRINRRCPSLWLRKYSDAVFVGVHAMNCQVARHGSVLGLFDRAAVCELLESGFLKPAGDDWCDGMTGWRRLDEVGKDVFGWPADAPGKCRAGA
jgi:hypothetical protein